MSAAGADGGLESGEEMDDDEGEDEDDDAGALHLAARAPIGVAHPLTLFA